MIHAFKEVNFVSLPQIDLVIGRSDKVVNFNYSGLDERKVIEHIADFISDLWQIHAFREGNTRTIAVFTIKYLRTFGYDISNDIFEHDSWYFRNALVRANYNNRKIGIISTSTFLYRFFGNMLLGDEYELRNRELHINNMSGDDSI